MGASISLNSVGNEVGIEALADLDAPVDQFVLFGVEVGAAAEEMGDGFAMAEIDEGAGEVHRDRTVGEAVRAGGIGGGEEFGDGGFRVVAAEGDLAEGLVSEEDGVAVAGVAGEVGNDLDELAGVGLGGVELVGGVGLAQGGGEGGVFGGLGLGGRGWG